MTALYSKKNLSIGYFINTNILPMHININEIQMWFKSIIISSFESDVSFSINNLIFYSFVICIIYTYIVYLFVRYSLPFLKTPMPFFSLLTNDQRLPPRHPVNISSFYWMINTCRWVLFKKKLKIFNNLGMYNINWCNIMLSIMRSNQMHNNIFSENL